MSETRSKIIEIIDKYDCWVGLAGGFIGDHRLRGNMRFRKDGYPDMHDFWNKVIIELNGALGNVYYITDPNLPSEKWATTLPKKSVTIKEENCHD